MNGAVRTWRCCTMTKRFSRIITPAPRSVLCVTKVTTFYSVSARMITTPAAHRRLSYSDKSVAVTPAEHWRQSCFRQVRVCVMTVTTFYSVSARMIATPAEHRRLSYSDKSVAVTPAEHRRLSCFRQVSLCVMTVTTFYSVSARMITTPAEHRRLSYSDKSVAVTPAEHRRPSCFRQVSLCVMTVTTFYSVSARMITSTLCYTLRRPIWSTFRRLFCYCRSTGLFSVSGSDDNRPKLHQI